MTLYALKPQFQDLLKPLVRGLSDTRITANQVTLAAAIGSAVVAMIIIQAAEARWVFLLLPVWLILRMGLNTIDGMLAREYRQESRLGAYLNEICDVVSDAMLVAPIAMVEPFGVLGIALLIFLAVGLGNLLSAATARHLTVAPAPVTRQNIDSAIWTGRCCPEIAA